MDCHINQSIVVILSQLQEQALELTQSQLPLRGVMQPNVLVSTLVVCQCKNCQTQGGIQPTDALLDVQFLSSGGDIYIGYHLCSCSVKNLSPDVLSKHPKNSLTLWALYQHAAHCSTVPGVNQRVVLVIGQNRLVLVIKSPKCCKASGHCV